MKLLAQLNISTNRIDPVFQDSGTLVGNLVSRFLLYAIAFSGMYFFVRTVIAGFTYLTSVGDPGKVQAAQQTLVHSLIGLVIVISAYFLGQLTATIFGLKFGLS